MSSKFPLFSPNPNPNPNQNHLLTLRPTTTSPTELRFSRWNNANAEPFNQRRREIKEIEDDIRRHRRYTSAEKIIKNLTQNAENDSAGAGDFKSRGTPSAPSRASIPGKKSKYSKRNKNPSEANDLKTVRVYRPPSLPPQPVGMRVGEKGVSYRFKDAPFDFQYSYTETKKEMMPLGLRETLSFSPFGPSTMRRPWTGRQPKYPVSEENSVAYGGEKEIEQVQVPGPMYRAASREEILGEPLSDVEVKRLVEGYFKTKKQLNMGRDGLLHNMLENVHHHWKRRRVCKIKCRGVCTVDMDSVRQQLEEKTGGKVIYSKGGVIFLYRGRNYNYRTRPRYPLMLWKPPAPLYPSLVQRAPEGLTLEEAEEMRKKGSQLPPICHLGKNGVYTNLVKEVKEAFDACELVKINCQNLKKHDCRKIGEKLKDLVPCILVSLEDEYLLVWRGKNWRTSFSSPEISQNEMGEANADTTSLSRTENLTGIGHNVLDLETAMSSHTELNNEAPTKDMSSTGVESLWSEAFDNTNQIDVSDQQLVVESEGAINSRNDISDYPVVTQQDSAISIHDVPTYNPRFVSKESCLGGPFRNNSCNGNVELEKEEVKPNLERKDQVPETLYFDLPRLDHDDGDTKLDHSFSENELELQERAIICSNISISGRTGLEGVMDLLNQAVESGVALKLDDAYFDANIVYEKSVALSKTSPPDPKFRHNVKKVVQESDEDKSEKAENQETRIEVASISHNNTSPMKSQSHRNAAYEFHPDLVPHRTLRVDELAKLLR